MNPSSGRFFALVFGLFLFSLAACSESSGPTVLVVPDSTELGVVVGSVDLTLTIFDPETGVPRTVGLGADGSPVSVAVRKEIAVVPMGLAPTAVVVDLVANMVIHNVALPDGSGATGVAFANDSIAIVANPNRNTVSPVNVRTGVAGAEITVGVFPQSAIAHGGRVYVLNANLVNFAPAGPGSVTVLDGSTLAVVGTVPLTGRNPASASVGPDARLYVVHSGDFAAGNGSVSVVDLGSLAEVDHQTGFGDFPGSASFGPSGNLYVASFSFGVAIWNPSTGAFLRGPDNAIAPAGVASVSALGFDAEGRLYTLEPECTAPSRAHRLAGDFTVERSVQVGNCPLAIAFTVIGE